MVSHIGSLWQLVLFVSQCDFWKTGFFFLLSTTTLQNLATQPTLFNNFSSKIFHIWVFNYADTISSRCLTRRLLLSRKLPRLHQGHLPKAGEQFTTTSLNTTTQTLPQDARVQPSVIPGQDIFQVNLSSSSVPLLLGLCKQKCNHLPWCAASWDWISVAQSGFVRLSCTLFFGRQLPNHFQAFVKQTSPPASRVCFLLK